ERPQTVTVPSEPASSRHAGEPQIDARHATDPDTTRAAHIAAEQKYVTMLYDKLDALRDETTRRLKATLADTGGPPQARTERDISTRMYTERISQLSSVEHGLCFGRIDLDSGESFH